MKKIREWIKEHEEASIFIGLILIFITIFGWVGKVDLNVTDGMKEAKKNRRVIECVFGGKVIRYEGWEDEWLEHNDQVLHIKLDSDDQVNVKYINTPCRKIRNKFIPSKRWRN